MTEATPVPKPESATASEFVPKLVTRLREGYSLGDLRADALAGLTVAIVALPLSMAIAIASGVGPERGLYTAIIGGFLVSALGGSRHQIGGPAGALIVLVSTCVAQIGIDGMVVATLMAGVMLAIAGVMRLGSYIRFIPYPVTVAFTAGIGLIIFLSQIHDLFGLTVPEMQPVAALPKLGVLWAARDTFNPLALAVAGATIAAITALRVWAPKWPSLLIAVAGVTAVTATLDVPVQTVEARFGALPRMLPMPGLPVLTSDLVWSALPHAFNFALMGAITALLSASVADSLSSRRHRSAAELVAQGAASIGTALFGGVPPTGAVARAVTNYRAGSTGPVSGMFHAAYVLIALLLAAPVMGLVPLPVFAGLLTVVAWNMADREAIWSLARNSRSDAVVMVTTFLLVVFVDLTTGIVVGFALGGLVFIRRMSDAAEVTEAPEHRTEGDAGMLVYRLTGPYFFGAAAQLGAVLDAIADHPRLLVVDFTDVPFIDSSGARSFALLARKTARRGGQLCLTGTRPEVRRALHVGGVHAPEVQFWPDVASIPRPGA